MSNDPSTGSVRDPRIQKALENWDANVAILATMPDKRLSEKLDVINMQSAIAHKKKLTSSIELLEIWWRQVVDARIYKAENNIPDAPNEIELAIADIETVMVKSEERQEIYIEAKPDQHSQPKPQIQSDDDSQLSLF
ncbi:MAG: hypothetical protein HYU69_07220 [Bacteroidetes bacterium]|nr:hypothetical protein [Bacteroidota bacterium]